MLKEQVQSFDERRDLFVGKDSQSTIAFATEHWTHTAQRAIQQRGRFAIALSGGHTPEAIYAALIKSTAIDWNKIWLFWSDERSVPLDHPDSNYHMAMRYFAQVPIPLDQIFPMHAEKTLKQNAKNYEELIRRHLDSHLFDLVMLGLGEDGHTASLFPNTAALSEETALVAANHVPSQNTWRMTLTFPCINQSTHIACYALGSKKAQILSQVLQAAIQSPFPASRIGTPQHRALWILDAPAAKQINV